MGGPGGGTGRPDRRLYEKCANGCAGAVGSAGGHRVFPRSLIGQIQRIGSARHRILNEDEMRGASGR